MREGARTSRQAARAPAPAGSEAAAPAASPAAALADPASLERAERLGHRITGAVQRRITFTDTLLPPPESGDHTRLYWRLNSLRRKGETVPELSWSELKEAVVLVQESPIDYGLVDFNDDQHIVLLAYEMRKQLMRKKEDEERVVERGEEETEPESERIEDQELEVAEKEEKWQRYRSIGSIETYRTLYLGAGASIAYELATRSPNLDPEDSLIIGPIQPWAGTRGPGVVAHPEHMISPMRQFVGDTRRGVPDDVFLERDRFSALIAAVLRDSGIKHVPHAASSLSRTSHGIYWVWVEAEGKHYRALEVVAGIGVGAHDPRGIKEELIAREEGQVGAKQVMDMDLFTKVAGKLEKTFGGVRIGSEESDKSAITIVLSGGNGAIDVAFDALNKGYKVHWIVGSSGPKFLPGFFNLAAYLPFLRSLRPEDYKEAGFAGDTPEGREEVKQEIARVEKLLVPLYAAQRHEMFSGVVERFLPETTRFEGVYFGRVGKDAVKAGAGKVRVTIGRATVEGDLMVYGVGQDNKTFELLKDVMADLVPERDVSGRFGAPGETTIGLSSRDKSLRVVGATAFRLAPSVKPSKEQVEAAQVELWKAYQHLKGLADHALAYRPFQHLWAEYSRYRKVFGTPEAEAKLKSFTEAAKEFDKSIETLDRSRLSPEQATAVDRFLGALGGARTRMEPVISSLPGNVLINDQLTATRSQTEASRGFLPYDIGRHANFLTDDRTALAVHIAARYPKLADKDDGEWPGEYAEKIVASRGREVAGGPDFAALLPDVPPAERSVPPYGRTFQKAWRELLEGKEKTA